MFTPDIRHTAVAPTRIHWLDNLRTSMIFLVVVVHAGGVYESSGGWSLFWVVDDPSTNQLSDLLLLIMDISVMPTVFFVSGCITPMSLGEKNGAAFLRARAKPFAIRRIKRKTSTPVSSPRMYLTWSLRWIARASQRWTFSRSWRRSFSIRIRFSNRESARSVTSRNAWPSSKRRSPA